MPMDVAKAKTPKGKPYLKIHSHGDVTAADAEALNKSMEPGHENADLAILATVDSGAKFSPEARQAFTRTNANPGQAPMPVAVVVTSAPLRVMLSFIIRMSPSASTTRFFANEGEALAYIEEKVA
jgi:hypothetical protein